MASFIYFNQVNCNLYDVLSFSFFCPTLYVGLHKLFFNQSTDATHTRSLVSLSEPVLLKVPGPISQNGDFYSNNVRVTTQEILISNFSIGLIG